MSEFLFEVLDESDLLSQIIQLEQESYPEDEAASPQTIQYRIANANEYFRVLLGNGLIFFKFDSWYSLI